MNDMYSGFFGLNQAPFSITPDPNFLIPLAQSQETLAHLMHTLTSDGIVVITGEPGTGKTTVAQSFIQKCREQHNVRVGLIHFSQLEPKELLRDVTHALDIPIENSDTPQQEPSVQALFRIIEESLKQSATQGVRTILIIDEAQNLTRESFDMIRSLNNIELDSKKLMQLVLMAQPELNRILAQKEMNAFEQRIVARYHLKELPASDWVTYVQGRLNYAGATKPIFTEEACALVGSLSHGIPRRMNVLCDRALIGAYVMGVSVVSGAVVRQAYIDLKNTKASATTEFFFRHLLMNRRVGYVALVVFLVAFVSISGYFIGGYIQEIGDEDPAQNQNQEQSVKAQVPAKMPFSLSGMLEGYEGTQLSPSEFLRRRVWHMMRKEDMCQSLLSGYDCHSIVLDSEHHESIKTYALPAIINEGSQEEGVVVGFDGDAYRVQSFEGSIQTRSPESFDRIEIPFLVPVGFEPTIERGARSSYVSWLKSNLDQWQAGERMHLALQSFPESEFDVSLESQLKAFEKEEGLSVDGIFDLEDYLYLVQQTQSQDFSFPSLNIEVSVDFER